MLLSYKYHFLFVHIAKTGGTSIRSTLQPLLWQDNWALVRWLCHRFSHLSGHTLATKLPRHAKIIAAQEMLPEDFFNQLFKFVFVRNPWDLQVSSYHHLQRERPHLIANKSFTEFLTWKLDKNRPYQYHIDTSIQFQTDYLVDLRGNILVDFIGHYETLEQDFHTICQHIGLKKIPDLQHKRKATERKAYQAYYTEETMLLVKAYFKEDIERFNYQF